MAQKQERQKRIDLEFVKAEEMRDQEMEIEAKRLEELDIKEQKQILRQMRKPEKVSKKDISKPEKAKEQALGKKILEEQARRERLEYVDVEKEELDRVYQSHIEQQKQYVESMDDGVGNIIIEDVYAYMHVIEGLLAGMNSDYETAAKSVQNYNALRPELSSVLRFFTPKQIHHLVRILMRHASENTMGVWDQLIGLLILNMPDFSNIKLDENVLEGVYDDLYVDYVVKSVYLQYLVDLVEASIDLDQQTAALVVPRIVALLDTNTAKFIVTKLLQRQPSKSIKYIFKQINLYINHHNVVLSRTMMLNYMRDLPNRCAGALMTIQNYYKYNDNQKSFFNVKDKNNKVHKFIVRPRDRKNDPMVKLIEIVRKRCLK
jgi:hypothetical protein